MRRSEPAGAVLNGPHYTLHLGWIATGTWADQAAARNLGTAPELLVADGFLRSLHERFNDRGVFTFRGSDGRTVNAQPYQRELNMGGFVGDPDQTPVVCRAR